MRILVVNYEYPPIGGGGGFVTRDILEALALKGHSISVITSHFGKFAKHEILNGVELIRVPVFFRRKVEVANMASLLAFLPTGLIETLLRRHLHAYDVINTHFAIPSGPLGVVLSNLLNIPQVLTIHGGDIYDPTKKFSPHRIPILSRTVRWVLNASDFVVAQSKDTRQNAYRYHQTQRPIEIIPLGIKVPKFSKSQRAAFDITDDETVFCTVGRLVKRKNLDAALAVIAQLKSTIKPRLMIIGEGPQRQPIKEQINALGLAGNVTMLGNVSDETKFQVMDLSDIYLSTALHEGFGLVFLEAMACGLPIICFDKGGQTDFLVDGSTGFLIPLNNLDTMTRKAIWLSENLDLRRSMGTFNLQRVQSFFIETCAEQYLQIFQGAIKQ